MKGDALSLLIILGIASIVGVLAYAYLSGKEEVKIEYPYIPSVPKYSDISFSPISARIGKLPTEYLDLSKDYFEFPYSIKSSFLEHSKVIICPFLSYTTANNELKNITGECHELILGPNEDKKGYIKISLENKEEISNSLHTSIVIVIKYSSNIRGICDLCIDSEYPSCTVSENSEVKLSPLLTPNPIKLDKDENFHIDLEVEKYSNDLTLNKIEFKPLETKVIRKSGSKKVEEVISIPGSCIIEREVKIGNPREFLRICTLSQPKIEIKETTIENSTSQYFKLECGETERKLKICEILEREKRTDVLKKMPIFLNVSFTTSKTYSYKLFLSR